MSKDEQERIVEKWHSMVVRYNNDDNNNKNNDNSNENNDTASTTFMEDRRWQIFVAARLHARCQEGPVRQALQKLHEHFLTNHGCTTLSVNAVATVDPLDWMDVISNLQYYRTKAHHLHQAAKQILQAFHGQVPEGEVDLQLLMGIGPVLANLLAFVNTRRIHQERYPDLK